MYAPQTSLLKRIDPPSQAMASASRAILLMPKIIEGIKEVSQFVKQEFTNPTNDAMSVKRLEGDYKGLAIITPINPLQRVLVDALAQVMGLPETPSMNALRLAMHSNNQKNRKDRTLLTYLKQNGIKGNDMLICMRALKPARHLIPNHGHLGKVKTNQERGPKHMLLPL